MSESNMITAAELLGHLSFDVTAELNGEPVTAPFTVYTRLRLGDPRFDNFVFCKAVHRLKPQVGQSIRIVSVTETTKWKQDA